MARSKQTMIILEIGYELFAVPGTAASAGRLLQDLVGIRRIERRFSEKGETYQVSRERYDQIGVKVVNADAVRDVIPESRRLTS